MTGGRRGRSFVFFGEERENRLGGEQGTLHLRMEGRGKVKSISDEMETGKGARGGQ